MKTFNRFGNMMPPKEYGNKPYLMYRRPFKIAGNLYFVGNEWCCSHLIDTGDGLILLDTPTAAALPGLICNITQLGFSLKELKYIIISHAHTDHFGAVSELVYMTGAKTFLGKFDAEDMREHPKRIQEMNDSMGAYNNTFRPDVELEDGDIITLGNTSIRCVLTPGHTIGVMSHFWTLEENGQTFHVGIYGGAGFVTMSETSLKENNLPLSMQRVFAESIDKVWNEPVDIMLGNHPFHNDTYQKVENRKDGEPNPFIDASEWHRFLQDLKERYCNFLNKTQDEISRDYQKSQWNDYYHIHKEKEGELR